MISGNSLQKKFNLLLVTSILISFLFGLVVGVYKVFPYQQIKSIKKIIDVRQVERNRDYRVRLFENFPSQAEILFIGDSITEYGEWNDFFPSLTVSNRGVAGDTTADILKRMDSLLSPDTKTVFIMLGINDIFKDISTDEISENYNLIVSSLKKEGMTVIIQSTIQCQIIKCGKEKVSQINILNNYLQNLSLKNDVYFLDLDKLSGKGGLHEDYTYDGIHLNAFGYQYWIKKINASSYLQ